MTSDKTHWWVGKDGQRLGPYSLTKLQQLVGAGELTPSDLVWRDGFDGWKRADEVAGLLAPPPLPTDYTATTDEELECPIRTPELDDSKAPVDPIPKAPTTISDPATPAKSRNQSYIARHWNGHLSLPVSYWINLYVLSVLLVVSFNFMLDDSEIGDTRLEIAGLLGLIIALLPITVWQIVGVWRSAENYIKRGRPIFWARAAQTLCVLGVLGTALEYMQYAEGYSEMAQIVFGVDDYSDFNLRLLDDASELEISGAIGFGLADEFEQMLRANPDVSIIRLNSHGGRIAEARRIREIISRAERKLATFTSTECVSACTVAYLGGESRYLKETARLGFHRPQFPGFSDADLEDDIAAEREYMLTHGIDESFVQKATNTLATDMWYPSHEELLRSGFVHQISSGKDFSNAGTLLRK